MIGIYKITNLDNGKMYIGQSLDIQHRWSEHRSELNHNKHDNSYLQNSWNLYGEDKFEFSIIELCSSDKLDDKEIYWIEKFRTYRGFENSNGYNLTLGGTGTKQLRPVLRFDLDGNFLDEWQSPRDAVINLNVDAQDIYGCTSKKYKYRHGNIWMWKDDYKDPSSLAWHLDRKCFNRVLQYDRNANLVAKYDSMRIAEKQLGYSIAPCLCHLTESSHGYIFVYENENIVVDQSYCDKVFTLLNNICNHPFYQLDRDGNIIKRYNCQREAVENGFSERLVSECLRNLRTKHKGYLFCYIEDINKYTKDFCNELFDRKVLPVKAPILQYTLDGKFVNRYEKLADVPDGFIKTSIGDCCKGRKKQYKGYLWRYEIND